MSIYLPVLALLIGILVFVAFRWKQREHDELFRLFQQQAKGRGGRVITGGLIYYPKLSFCSDGVEFTASALVGGAQRGP